MSVRYSNSPSLHLTIAESVIYRYLHGAFSLLALTSLYRLQQRGYPVLSLLLLVPVACCCRQLARQPLAGAVLSWSQGQWSIVDGSGLRPVTLRSQSSALPWVIYIAWEDARDGARGAGLLFRDSAAAQDLRRLRVRLALQR